MAQTTKSRHGDGSVYRTADGRLRASVPVRDPLTGKTRRVYLSARTDSEMREKVRQARQESDRIARTPNLSDYSAAWLRMARHRVAHSSWLSYGTALRAWVLPSLGTIEVSRLTPAHVESMQADLAARGMAPSTIVRARKVLILLLSDAEREGMVRSNAGRLAHPPRRPQAPIRTLAPEEVGRLVTVARRHGTVGSLVLLAVSTGLRRGEMLALRWEAVRDGTLTIRSGKTARARRTIVLPALAREAIERERGNGSEYVFSLNGSQIYPVGMAEAWHVIRTEAGVPSARLHDLRHTAATLLLSAGVPVTDVSAMLGHSTPAITFSIYAHVIPGGQERTAAAMDAVLGAAA